METDKVKNAAGRIIAITCLLSLAYAVLRYHIMGPVPWKDFPFYILNKGISLTAILLLCFNFTFGPLKNLGVNVADSWLNSRQALGMTGFLLVLIHALISFLLFSPDVYHQFFEENNTLTLFGGLSMLAGVLGFVILWAFNLSFKTFIREDQAFIAFITSRRFMLVALLMGLAHVFFMGYEGWLNPGGWHGGLPPISLVAFVICAVGYIINLFGRK